MGAKGQPKRIQIAAVVTRADGTVDDFGVISDTAKKWRFGPGRLLADLKIKRANRRIELGN